VMQRCKARTGAAKDDFAMPKTVEACPGLADRCRHPRVGNPTNEAYLMHGSNPTSATSILGTSFKIDFAGATAGTMFGPGIYLAEASSKADEYARDEKGGAYDGLFAVLVCRAILGRSFRAEKSGDYHAKCTEGDFDSVLGDREKAVGTFREFIFFHEGSVYPEYVAFYRREYKDGEAPSPTAAMSVAPAPMTMPSVSPSPAVRSPIMVEVVVPHGQGPGSVLEVQTPAGQKIQVTVPPGYTAGSKMTVQA